MDTDADRGRPSAEEWLSSGSVCGEGGYSEKEKRSSGRASVPVDRGGGKSASSSQRLIQSAGTKYALLVFCSAYAYAACAGFGFMRSQICRWGGCTGGLRRR